ncbi:MAG: hypothetical protein ACREGC_02240, partial [Minisyncoccia bacterium]
MPVCAYMSSPPSKKAKSDDLFEFFREKTPVYKLQPEVMRGIINHALTSIEIIDTTLPHDWLAPKTMDKWDAKTLESAFASMHIGIKHIQL